MARRLDLTIGGNVAPLEAALDRAESSAKRSANVLRVEALKIEESLTSASDHSADALERLNRAEKLTEETLARLARETVLAGKASAEATIAYEAQQGALRELTESQKLAVIMQARARDEAVEAARQQAEAVQRSAREQIDAHRRVEREQAETLRRQSAAIATWQTQLKSAPQAIEAAGRNLTMGVTIPLIAAGAASLKASANFDQALRNVDSIAKLGNKEFAELRQNVLALVDDQNIRQGPKDLAVGLYDVYSSGFKGQKALDVLKDSAYGASAGMTQTSVSGKALMAVLNSGIPGVKTSREAMDVLFKQVDLGSNSFEELATQIGDVLPTAAAAKITLQEVASGIAVMTRGGISAAESVTALNSMLVHLIKPSQEAKKVMKDLGIEYGQIALEKKGLTGFLSDVVTKVGNNRQALAEIMPEMRGYKALLSLTRNDGKDYIEMLDGMAKASEGAGATTEALRRQNAGAIAEWERVKAEGEKVAIMFGDELVPAAREVLKEGRAVLGWLKDLTPEQKAAYVQWGKWLLILGPVALGIGKIAGAVQTLIALRNTYVAATAAKVAANLALARSADAAALAEGRLAMAGAGGAAKGLGVAGVVGRVALPVAAGAVTAFAFDKFVGDEMKKDLATFHAKDRARKAATFKLVKSRYDYYVKQGMGSGAALDRVRADDKDPSSGMPFDSSVAIRSLAGSLERAGQARIAHQQQARRDAEARRAEQRRIDAEQRKAARDVRRQSDAAAAQYGGMAGSIGPGGTKATRGGGGGRRAKPKAVDPDAGIAPLDPFGPNTTVIDSRTGAVTTKAEIDRAKDLRKKFLDGLDKLSREVAIMQDPKRAGIAELFGMDITEVKAIRENDRATYDRMAVRYQAVQKRNAGKEAEKKRAEADARAADLARGRDERETAGFFAMKDNPTLLGKWRDLRDGRVASGGAFGAIAQLAEAKRVGEDLKAWTERTANLPKGSIWDAIGKSIKALRTEQDEAAKGDFARFVADLAARQKIAAATTREQTLAVELQNMAFGKNADAIQAIITRTLETERLERFADTMNSVADRVADGMTDAFARIGQDGQSLFGGLLASAQRVAAEIGFEFLRSQIRSGLSSLVGSAVGAFAGGGGGKGPSFNMLGVPIPNAVFSGGRRAVGGNVAAGIPYWVGEEGPEPFIPSTSGSIGRAGSVMGGDTYITINISATDSQSVIENKGKIAAELVAEMNRRARRNA